MSGWILLPPEAVPAQWRDRAIDVCLVPLLPEEAAGVLAGEAPQPALTEDELPLARLVAAGLANTAIARRLGVDPRTVQRRINALCERLGAPSKAELAVLLAAHGVAPLQRHQHRRRVSQDDACATSNSEPPPPAPGAPS